jgi:CRISPR-associated protein Cas1
LSHELLGKSEVHAVSPTPDFDDDLDDLEWAERSEFWLQELAPKKTRAIPKRREHLPLILAGHGVRMNIDNGALVIRNGRTHHPQIPEEWRLFRGDRFLPSRIVMLDGDGHLTFDVLAWLSEQNIPLIQIDWMGTVVTVAGAHGYSADRKLAGAQKAAKENGKAMDIAVSLIREKLTACAATIDTLTATAPSAAQVVKHLLMENQKMISHPPNTISEILGIEGRAASRYFGAMRDLPLKWKGVGARPVPSDWHKIGSRLSPLSKRNRDAVHPVNAMLNYGYSMLENQVRVAVVAAGLDPTIGCLHSTYDEQHALVFDLMEPLRPVVDREVLKLVRRHNFSPGDFTLTAEGICRLNPQLTRAVVKQVDLEAQIGAVVRTFVGQIA